MSSSILWEVLLQPILPSLCLGCCCSCPNQGSCKSASPRCCALAYAIFSTALPGFSIRWDAAMHVQCTRHVSLLPDRLDYQSCSSRHLASACPAWAGRMPCLGRQTADRSCDQLSDHQRFLGSVIPILYAGLHAPAGLQGCRGLQSSGDMSFGQPDFIDAQRC